MDMSDNRHVVSHKNGWAVRTEKNKRASRVFNFKGEALHYAREASRKNNVCMIVHDREGRIESFDCMPEVGNQHIVPKLGGWAVLSAGADEITNIYLWKKDAIDLAEDIARRNDVCVVLHDDNGKIENKTCPGR